MTRERLEHRLAEVREEKLPLPAAGATAERHRRLMEVGREDLTLAKLAEAHWDALAILEEAGQPAASGALYAVWASEIPGGALRLEPSGGSYRVSGMKRFCSGTGMVDRALVTVGLPEPRLVEVDLRANAGRLEVDGSGWATEAFRLTQTGSVTFRGVAVAGDGLLGGVGWYVERPGFWHGACGPAACWAGGAAGLLDYARRSRRDDAHTLAHLGAMQANVWGMEAALNEAGQEIDARGGDAHAAQVRALTARHLVEQACTDTLRRFARAYGPRPMAMDEDISRRMLELDLYLRQSHGERDLEALGQAVKQGSESRRQESEDRKAGSRIRP